MASLGDNIRAVAVHGTFDDCQRLVKQAFADDDLRTHVWLTPANSINLGRLAAAGLLLLPVLLRQVGTGGRWCVGAERKFRQPDGRADREADRACRCERFVAATNVNDVVPKYLQSG